ncbi:hypothetical protein THRCLA_21383 [Thraustotheca clavata]|uniref:Chromatin target of PRMT1 protein C-terminal domain-containing protein n=1 Tax=Thraustotheca clavata TaxID=74557 RepID=A0A1V9ZX22_9STRA|nr:hypothetical protein THRCLA_21383 [Thraustotheca clavata]
MVGGGKRTVVKPRRSTLPTPSVVGASSLPLSVRFKQLHATPSKQPKGPGPKKVAVAMRTAQRAQRQDLVNARRGLPPVMKVKKKLAKQPVLAKKKQLVKVRKARAASSEKKKDVDLDMDMDEYWFKAGKGPDPKQKQLDAQMDQYWANKPAQESSVYLFLLYWSNQSYNAGST